MASTPGRLELRTINRGTVHQRVARSNPSTHPRGRAPPVHLPLFSAPAMPRLVTQCRQCFGQYGDGALRPLLVVTAPLAAAFACRRQVTGGRALPRGLDHQLYGIGSVPRSGHRHYDTMLLGASDSHPLPPFPALPLGGDRASSRKRSPKSAESVRAQPAHLGLATSWSSSTSTEKRTSLASRFAPQCRLAGQPWPGRDEHPGAPQPRCPRPRPSRHDPASRALLWRSRPPDRTAGARGGSIRSRRLVRQRSRRPNSRGPSAPRGGPDIPTHASNGDPRRPPAPDPRRVSRGGGSPAAVAVHHAPTPSGLAHEAWARGHGGTGARGHGARGTGGQGARARGAGRRARASGSRGADNVPGDDRGPARGPTEGGWLDRSPPIRTVGDRSR